jgi:nucleoside permease NupC
MQIFAPHKELNGAPPCVILAKLVIFVVNLIYFFYSKLEQFLSCNYSFLVIFRKYVSMLDAFCGGAVSAVPIIGQVLVVLFACFSLLEFVNATLTWFGDRVGIEQLTVQVCMAHQTCMVHRTALVRLGVGRLNL